MHGFRRHGVAESNVGLDGYASASQLTNKRHTYTTVFRDIADWAMRLVIPQGEKQRSLQNEPIAVFGLTQSVQASFQSIAGQD